MLSCLKDAWMPALCRVHVALRIWLARDPSNWCVVSDGLRMDWESRRNARPSMTLQHDFGILSESLSVARSLVPA